MITCQKVNGSPLHYHILSRKNKKVQIRIFFSKFHLSGQPLFLFSNFIKQDFSNESKRHLMEKKKKKKRPNGIPIRGCIWYLEALTSNGCEDSDRTSRTVTDTQKMQPQYHKPRSYGPPVKMAIPPAQHSDNDRSSGELRALDCNLTSLCDHIQLEGFTSGSFSDIVVHAMGSTYRLHRLILSRSSYFRFALLLHTLL